MATVSPGLHLPVQDAALKAGRQNVAQHHQGFFIAAGREVVETSIGLRDAHVLGLSSVDGVAQNPAAVPAMGIHASFAEVALQAGSDARDDDLVSNVKLRDARSDLLDYTNALVAENASIGHRRQISLQNVKIGSANRRSRNPHDGIARILDGRDAACPPMHACPDRDRPALSWWCCAPGVAALLVASSSSAVVIDISSDKSYSDPQRRGCAVWHTKNHKETPVQASRVGAGTMSARG